VGIGQFFFGARMYDPEIGGFTSTDPAGEFWSSYGYTGGNPINLIDPLGLSTCIDENGIVTEVRNDKDLNVYSWTKESANDVSIGATQDWNEFKVGYQFMLENVNYRMHLHQELYVKGQDALSVALASANGGVLDIKLKLGATNGYLYDGYWMTGESVGNRQAGKNAAMIGAPWLVANAAAGALHVGSRVVSAASKSWQTRSLVMPNLSGSTLQYFGETDYTGRQFIAGYNSAK
jgi:hypothetical protein